MDFKFSQTTNLKISVRWRGDLIWTVHSHFFLCVPPNHISIRFVNNRGSPLVLCLHQHRLLHLNQEIPVRDKVQRSYYDMHMHTLKWSRTGVPGDPAGPTLPGSPGEPWKWKWTTLTLTCTCICTHTHTHMHTHAHTCTHTRTHVHMHAYAHTHMHTHTCTHTH